MNLPLRWGGTAPGDHPNLWTDNEYYAPGEPLTISGSGWQPGETVTLRARTVPGSGHVVTFTTVTDTQGRFEGFAFRPEAHDEHATTCWVTAVGDRSLCEAQIVFLGCVRPRVPVCVPRHIVTILDGVEVVATAVIDAAE